ncbi:MAG: hypothetical protein OSA81_05895 [Longimicrobiales bacterium]|nr:hypothetical protein [Longimicrobiales bacterium]
MCSFFPVSTPLDNGQVVGNVSIPDPDDLGLNPDVVITNALTVQDDPLFISNGEGSVYAAVGGQSFETSACADTQMVEVLGQIQFGSLESVNHASYNSGRLWVAAGVSGIKVVDVEVNREFDQNESASAKDG